MPGLLVVLTEAGGERRQAAIELAASAAALGRPVRVLLRGAALSSLLAPAADTLPLLLDLGCEVAACQTALADCGIDAALLPAGVSASGLLAMLKDAGDWQLLLA